jgi:hypothetical protein
MEMEAQMSCIVMCISRNAFLVLMFAISHFITRVEWIPAISMSPSDGTGNAER